MLQPEPEHALVGLARTVDGPRHMQALRGPKNRPNRRKEAAAATATATRVDLVTMQDHGRDEVTAEQATRGNSDVQERTDTHRRTTGADRRAADIGLGRADEPSPQDGGCAEVEQSAHHWDAPGRRQDTPEGEGEWGDERHHDGKGTLQDWQTLNSRTRRQAPVADITSTANTQAPTRIEPENRRRGRTVVDRA
jgi:hypothetical protein